jgi:hypothetical protein
VPKDAPERLKLSVIVGSGTTPLDVLPAPKPAPFLAFKVNVYDCVAANVPVTVTVLPAALGVPE